MDVRRTTYAGVITKYSGIDRFPFAMGKGHGARTEAPLLKYGILWKATTLELLMHFL